MGVAALAILCGMLLLAEPTAESRGLFRAIQIGAAGIILGLAVINIGPHAGVALAILGALLLLWGAWERYR